MYNGMRWGSDAEKKKLSYPSVVKENVQRDLIQIVSKRRSATSKIVWAMKFALQAKIW